MKTFSEYGEKLVRGEAPPPPVGRLLGFVPTSIETGRAVFEMQADAAMGFAYASTLRAGESFTTVELKINFFRPVRNAKLIAEANVLRAGTTLGYVECDVNDTDGKLVARVASTCMKLRARENSAT